MIKILSSLSKTIHASFSLTVLLFLVLFYLNGGIAFDTLFWSWLCRFIHVIVAIMWIGLLWYFNFVQIPNMEKIPDDQIDDIIFEEWRTTRDPQAVCFIFFYGVITFY